AATPETVGKMVKGGLEVSVEAGAGAASAFSDAAYEAAGARVVPAAEADAAWAAADAVLTVRPPDPERARSLRSGALLVGLLAPYKSAELVRALADRGASSMAMELVPRISRAQSMDALSSQASIAGYKAVLLAAATLGRYFPLLMTAAGTIPPSRVVVMGAGVAGLQAVATAKRLGAVVEVSDIRPEVKEQVESLGGKFIELPMQESGAGAGGYAKEMGEEFLRRQREIVTEHLAKANVAITTALVPGRPAPRLITADMVSAMRRGAVIVDLAIEQGGNCELSRADETVETNGVTILAPSNLAATLAEDASTLYARNVLALLQLVLRKDGDGPTAIALDLEDEVVAGSLLTHGGRIAHEPTAQALQEVTS
ncbi:MAG TPA: Re/Si-specific NAD(P)(+) transhydrogenase subunit alpha, partial [Thermoanaerobaculia bacterium]|nr:Re/Si-specific NAD(P)(+) transhydrogenase subunit alpha [Thermoanaerobaculia bacterium]